MSQIGIFAEVMEITIHLATTLAATKILCYSRSNLSPCQTTLLLTNAACPRSIEEPCLSGTKWPANSLGSIRLRNFSNMAASSLIMELAWLKEYDSLAEETYLFVYAV